MEIPTSIVKIILGTTGRCPICINWVIMGERLVPYKPT